MDMCGDSKNKVIADKYLKWISLNYTPLKNKYRKYCIDNQYDWDDDVFSDTYLKIYEIILRKGLKDDSETGFDNYTFQSFYRNIKREKQYSRNKYRDNTSDLFGDYERYNEQHNLSQDEKIRQDCYKDFAIIYMMKKAEEHFDDEYFHLFNLKMLGDLTYKELQEKCPNAKAIRQKVVEVKNYLKENVTKDEIQKAFNEFSADF